MNIDDKLISYLEALARLELSQEEHETAKKNLTSVVNYIDKLNELDTEKVEPMSHVLPICNVFREDLVKPSFGREEILKNAPDKKDGCFKVPKTVE